MPMHNPFWHGTPVPLKNFISRGEKAQTIVSRISTGQSTILSGSPRSGKTSLLHYLMTEENQTTLYEDANKLIFSYLDVSLWNDEYNRVQFWAEALKPIEEYAQADDANPQDETKLKIAKTFQTCQRENFGTFVLEKLFAQLKQSEKQLVLIIDEFDLVLQHPTLKSSIEFFGGMRSVASRSDRALVIIMTTNISSSQLTEKTQDFTRAGSPYFNFMDEVILGPLSTDKIDELLSKDDQYFTPEDRAFIKEIAGGHPYLLQVLASSLWTLYETQPETDFVNRRQQAEKDFYLKVNGTLDRIWRTWQEPSQQAFMSVALVQMEKLKRAFKRQGIDTDSISKHIPRLESELQFLKKYGFLTENKSVAGGWQVYPKIFLPFIIDKKLKLEYRKKLPPEIWKDLLTRQFG